jgi:hypothetical protein
VPLFRRCDLVSQQQRLDHFFRVRRTLGIPTSVELQNSQFMIFRTCRDLLPLIRLEHSRGNQSMVKDARRAAIRFAGLTSVKTSAATCSWERTSAPRLSARSTPMTLQNRLDVSTRRRWCSG